MTLRNATRPAALLALVLALAAVGCSQQAAQPLAPAERAQAVDAGALPVAPDTSLTPIPIRDADTLITLIRPVSGARSDTLEAGCVRLAVPAGAISGQAVIDLKARSDGRLVELHITPADKNGFWVPIELSADVSAMSPTIRNQMAWFWVDPATGDWVLLEDSRFDDKTGRVSAQLHHFSIYALANRNQGRAGW